VKKIPGIARPGSSGYEGKSASVPFLSRDLELGQAQTEVGPLRARRDTPLVAIEEIKRRAAQLVLRRAGEYWDRAGPRSSNFLASAPWAQVAGGELDLDKTLHQYVARAGRVTRDDIYLYLRAPEQRNYVIFIDHSGSMVGEKLLLGALLAGVLAQLTSQRRGDYAVIAFDEELSQIKGLGEERGIDDVIGEILLLPEGRSTNLAQVLRKAGEISALSALPADCIMISDFMPTKGVTTFAGLKRLAETVPSLYICYMEEREAAVELYGGERAPNLVGFKLYRWWSQRMVGEERFHEIKTIDDVEGLIYKLSGYGPGDRV